MQSKIGAFIDPVSGATGTNDTSGKPGPKPDSRATDSGSKSDAGAKGGSEFVEGFETSNPADTIRIAGTGTRRTRNGTVDRRTRAGRERNPDNETAPVQGTLASLALEDLLFSIHATLAELTAIKECELDRDDAEKLAKATRDVLKHYNVPLDPKKLAILNLCSVAGAIYIPRIGAYRIRTAKEEKPVKRAAPFAVPNPAATAAPATAAPAAPSAIWGNAPPMESQGD